MPDLILYRLKSGIAVTRGADWYQLPDTEWDALINQADVKQFLNQHIENGSANQAGIRNDC